MANQNLLHNAFIAFMRYYLAKYKKKTPKKKSNVNYMGRAYESFLKGNWEKIPKNNPNKVTKTFGTM